MATPTINTILNNLIVVALDTTLWSGEKKLRPEDLGGVKLPPDKLASLGSKRTFDPVALRIFKTLKRRAERTLSDVGVRFLSGYAVPESALDTVFQILVEIETEFAEAKRDFLFDYDAKLEAWLKEAGEWSEIVRKAVEPASSVANKLHFGFTAYKVGEPVAASVKVQETLARQVGGLSDQLMQEVAQAAKETLEESYNGRTEVTRKALSPVNNIKAKLEGLMFLNPSEIGGLVMNVNAVLAAVPKSGPIQGAVLAGIVGVLSQMANIQGFVAAAAKVQQEETKAAPAAAPEKKAKKAKAAAVPEQVQAVAEIAPVPEVQVIPEPVEETGWFW
ncbi:DUF3150 domain-containing protein [Geomonas subterranea]|uniref:DUF3150 domain-containing protein n=1 Tax=Geomonas subterranea TaxID=2847989 RepID=UPI001CD80016|nr:DUF3150 domain-containing protein [Geomonas fuzhouensis]